MPEKNPLCADWICMRGNVAGNKGGGRPQGEGGGGEKYPRCADWICMRGNVAGITEVEGKREGADMTTSRGAEVAGVVYYSGISAPPLTQQVHLRLHKVYILRRVMGA